MASQDATFRTSLFLIYYKQKQGEAEALSLSSDSQELGRYYQDRSDYLPGQYWTSTLLYLGYKQLMRNIFLVHPLQNTMVISPSQSPVNEE